MTESEARALAQEALKQVDFINLGRVLSSLANGYAWKRFDNSVWRPDFNRAFEDKEWLAENAEAIKEAIEYFYKNRTKRGE